MWSNPAFDPEQAPAEDAVLEAVSTVMVTHLHGAASKYRDGEEVLNPVLIQLDGPGRSLVLDRLEARLDPVAEPASSVPKQDTCEPLLEEAGKQQEPWSAVRFDAWQYQRVAPPWWWLMSALDRQLNARARRQGRWPWLRRRGRDAAWRLGELLKDLLWAVPGAALLVGAWALSRMDMWSFLQWFATVIGGVTAVVAFAVSVVNLVRRHLLAQSPGGASALLRHTDPMSDLLRRYTYVAGSTDTPIVVLIDNLDRCHASYVVEMLEGIQTLFRRGRPSALGRARRGGRPVPLVVFMIAADRAWLCDSFVQVYGEFKDSIAEPGRPFGLAFLEKVFDFALRIPTVPPALNAAFACEAGDVRRRPEQDFADCRGEAEVRIRLRKIEAECTHVPGDGTTNGAGRLPAVPAPRQGARIGAVRRLAEIELDTAGGRRQCNDTASTIDAVVRRVNPGPAVVRQLDTAYCVHRTSQLLGGHAFDDRPEGMERLALWTILDLKWPRLATHLAARPDDIEHLRDGTVPENVDEELGQVFRLRDAQQLGRSALAAGLSADEIAALTAPLTMDDAPGETREREPSHA